jgi:hypothetical protein
MKMKTNTNKPKYCDLWTGILLVINGVIYLTAVLVSFTIIKNPIQFLFGILCLACIVNRISVIIREKSIKNKGV